MKEVDGGGWMKVIGGVYCLEGGRVCVIESSSAGGHGGRLTPADFAGARRDGSTCYHSKRGNCKRHFLGCEKGVPGRPRAQQEAGGGDAGAAGQGCKCGPNAPDHQHYVDKVWGFRCALAPILLPFALASDRAPRFVLRAEASTFWPGRRRRRA